MSRGWLCTRLLLGLAATLAGCSGSGDEHTGSNSAALTCTVDQALIDQHRDCRADDQCPCGAHCELGQCSADCGPALSCSAGQRCDQFGRCRAAADTSVVQALSGEVSGLVRVEQARVLLASDGSAKLRFRAEQKDSGKLRIVASSGYELDCSGSGSFASECNDQNLAQGKLRELTVRVVAGQLPGAGTVRIFHQGKTETISIGAAGAATTASLAGVYSGSATLTRVALGDAAALAAAPGTQGVVVPISAKIYAGGVIAVSDPLYALNAAGSWIGTLDASDASSGSALFPRSLLDKAQLTQSLYAEVLGAIDGASYVASGNTLEITLPIQDQGLLSGDATPRASWALSLQRTGDLDSGASAPAVPADVAPTLGAAAVATPSDWQTAVTAGFQPWSGGRPKVDLDQLLASWQADSGDPSQGRRVDACTLSGRTVAGQQATGDEWRAASFTPPTFVAPAAIASDVKSGKNALLGVALSVASAKYVKSASIANVKTTAAMPADGAIPCALDFLPAQIYCYDGLPNSMELQLASVDRCAEIAAELRCDVQPTTGVDAGAGVGTFDFDLQLNTSNDLASSSCTDTALPVMGAISKVCVLPPVSWNCGELVSCADASGIVSYSPANGSSALLPVSGDLACGGGMATLATVADFNRNQPANMDTASTVIEHALADLNTLRAPPLAAFPVAAALDAPRLLVALEYATEVDRQRLSNPGLGKTPGATHYAERLLQQWLGVHALVAHESSQHWQVSPSILGVVPDPLFPSPSDALSASLDGWSLLFHPRFAAALATMDGAALAQPDYRADWLGSVSVDPNYQQTDGLPIAILDTVRAQLTLTDLIVDQAWPKHDSAVFPLLGRTLRDAVLALTLASDLYARAAAASGASGPAWADAYQRANTAAVGKLRAVLSRATSMQRDENPLGIDDSDLPLYFFGTSVDPVARFSAISDYLLGNGASGMSAGWAPQVVAQADAAAQLVGAAYQKQVSRQYQAALTSVDNAAQLDAIRLHFGDLVANYCGTPGSLMTSQLLEQWPDFAGTTCYFASDRAECAVDTSSADAELDADTVLYHFCIGTELSRLTGISDIYQNETLNLAVRQANLSGVGVCHFGPGFCFGSTPAQGGCLQCGPATTGELHTQQIAALNAFNATPDQLEAAQTTCIGRYPNAHQNLPSLADMDMSPLERADCYRGSLGDAAFALLDAAKDVDIARGQYSDHLDAYEIEMNNCTIKLDSNAALDKQRTDFNNTLHDLRDSKAFWDKTAAIAGGVKDCATASTMGAGLSGVSLGASAVASVVACAAAATESAADVESIDTQEKIDNAQSDFDAFSALLGEQTDVKLCMNEAHQELVGLQTAAQQINRALLDLAHAHSTLSGGVGSAQLAYDQGRAALATAQGRTVRPPALDAWVDQDIGAFVGRMQQARRVSYLAERAVEYEYQASLQARQQILSAQTPADLSSVLTDLQNTSGTLGINGNRPSSLKVVLSMRDHLLQLFDKSRAPEGELRLSEADRFHLLLNDKRFAVYEGGVYAGQRIPFDLVPLDALHGDGKGIAIFSQTDCAERIWSVNASILGAGPIQRGSQTSSFARVDLLKANTFYSQWCGSGQTEPFQIASVRPSRNLFRDPAYGLAGAAAGSANGTPSTDTADEITQYSRARIQAYFNVDRDTFEADDYANGDTSELAARGMFGDYALFFPAGVLSIPTRDAQGNVTGYSDGLNLDAVDDILLRIDYVSVAR